MYSKILQKLKDKKKLLIIIASFIFVFSLISIAKTEDMADRLKGRILLQVEQNGEAWYINPADKKRYYMGRPQDAFNLMRDLGVGIATNDLEKILIADSNLLSSIDNDGDGLSVMIEDSLGTSDNDIDTDKDGYDDKTEVLAGYNPNGAGKYNIDNSFVNKHKGKIFLQVQQNGEAWYINTEDNKRYFLGRPVDAFSVMRESGLGITDSDLNQIPEFETTPVCGNSRCESDETCNNCSFDCGACSPTESVCGNSMCEWDETCSTCTSDCGICPLQCGNDLCEVGEMLACSEDCLDPIVCGDGACEGDEVYESCPADCPYIPEDDDCGDGVINGSEECDGSDLDGNDCTIINQGFSGGTLACSNCLFDISSCTFSVCGDGDGDGYGDPASEDCAYSTLDCDDEDVNINPRATEICGDGIDNDCDGTDLICPIEKEKFFGSAYQVGSSQTEYEAKFSELFDQITPENDGKWGVFEPTEDNFQFSNYDAMVNFANANGISIKHHTFVWGLQEPTWIGDYNNSTQVKAFVRRYMQTIVDTYPDIEMIDVVNEPLHAHPSYKSHLGGDGSTGWDWLIWTYEIAREVAPNKTLLINDYNILQGWEVQGYVEVIQVLKDRGLIDGIGVQAHGLEGTDSATIQDSLDALAELDLPIYISELDINIQDDISQKDKYVEIFPTIWNHPSVEGVTLWGFYENKIWKSDAYLVRSDGTERPALVWLKSFFAQN